MIYNFLNDIWRKVAHMMGNYIPRIRAGETENEHILCSQCFQNQGLRLDAEKIGIDDLSPCKNCASRSGRKLNRPLIGALAHRFFVRGTFLRCDYGAAPIVQFNEHQTTSINMSPWLEADLHLIERAIRVGFFYYGPRLWMVGEVEPLKELESPETRKTVLDRILKMYPEKTLKAENLF